MQSFLKNSALGLLLIVAMAGLGYFVLTPPAATAALPAAEEIASHSADCPICRLPLYGRGGTPSKWGRDAHTSVDAADATPEGTIRR
jgi:hypothetical protein